MNDRDAGEFARAYGLHAPAVHATARRILGDVPAAEDVVQEVFLELWRRPEAYDPHRGALRSWLCTIARNKAIDQVRRSQRQSAAMAILAEVGLAEDAAEAVLRKELAGCVRDAIDTLPAAHRAAIVLAYYQGFTYRQVALTLSIPEGTAKSRLRLGLRRLNQLLAAIDDEGAAQ
ncbi:RNA polymerase sigma factor SigK [Rhizocola hellebori]|uniref:RNA polymerase sigma factor SigK n=1 Tax=Rhizocola hellebori TaxID=1392758 RepID=A0A8J3VIF9_9ACTN|nr:sigma-70 family RNA polymerase sigma factor [Rhizocola hellebori]GIH07016.1 RNA polymerase sigma factor SigK [Rhizocola hellebori]